MSSWNVGARQASAMSARRPIPSHPEFRHV
jgi:hypothetical protein